MSGKFIIQSVIFSFYGHVLTECIILILENKFILVLKYIQKPSKCFREPQILPRPNPPVIIYEEERSPLHQLVIIVLWNTEQSLIFHQMYGDITDVSLLKDMGLHHVMADMCLLLIDINHLQDKQHVSTDTAPRPTERSS